MCVCVYVCVCVCMHVCMYAYKGAVICTPAYTWYPFTAGWTGGGGGKQGKKNACMYGCIHLALSVPFLTLHCMIVPVGAGTFGTVRAGVYKPKNGGPEVECAIKVLKPADELPNQKVKPYISKLGVCT